MRRRKASYGLSDISRRLQPYEPWLWRVSLVGPAGLRVIHEVEAADEQHAREIALAKCGDGWSVVEVYFDGGASQ